MVRRYALFIILLIGLLATPFLMHAQERIKAEREHFEREESFSIHLDSRDLTEDQKTINLSDYNYKPPDECNNNDVVCFESSLITVHVKKMWELATVLPITDPDLETDVFSASFPEIQSKTWEDLRNNPEELMIAQRTLFERGLMNVLPTGQYGYITEQAVAKLQGLKNIEEIDWEKGQVIIGPQTIVEINELKKRLITPTYLESSPLPTTYENVLSPALSKRVDSLDQLIPQYTPTNEQKENVTANQAMLSQDYEYDMKPDGSILEFRGEAVIQK